MAKATYPVRRQSSGAGPFGPASGVRQVPIDDTIAPPRPAPLLPGRHVLDAWGDGWLVEDSRATEHGFEIYLGRPAEVSGPQGRTTIITEEVAAHFERHRRSPDRLDVPLSQTTIKRIRSVLGHHRYQDAEVWWLERVQDLERLTIADFCVRHKVSAGAVSEARTALVGGKQRSKDWWKTPEMLALLNSKRPTAWIAQQLGVSAVRVRALRSKT